VLGKSGSNVVEFFSSIELITLPADPDWLDDAAKTIGQYRKRKNAQRHGSTTEERADAAHLRQMAQNCSELIMYFS
jgi:hypothetical protein